MKIAQSYPTLCDPMDYTVNGILQARILEWVASHSLLQGIFLTQGLNPGLLPCRQSLYHLSHQGSPKVKAAIAQSIQDESGGLTGRGWTLLYHIYFHCKVKS